MKTIEYDYKTDFNGKSSWIKEAHYSLADSTLYVTLRGSVLQYSTVYVYSAPYDDYHALTYAPSVGAFFNSHKSDWVRGEPVPASEVNFVKRESTTSSHKRDTYTVTALVKFTISGDSLAEAVANMENHDLEFEDVLSVVKNA